MSSILFDGTTVAGIVDRPGIFQAIVTISNPPNDLYNRFMLALKFGPAWIRIDGSPHTVYSAQFILKRGIVLKCQEESSIPTKAISS